MFAKHKEFFAESEVAFLGVKAYFPFSQAKLREREPEVCKFFE